MRILAIDSSAVAASCAVLEGDELRTQFFINAGLTHSQTLVPMIERALDSAAIRADSIEGVAVAAGPGSFTGVRIGVSSAKGFAFARRLPCVGVSTLEAMAHQMEGNPSLVCSVMDARCNQVYNAMFRVSYHGIERLCEDRAVALDVLEAELAKQEEPVYILGDGAGLCYTGVQEHSHCRLAPPHLRMQSAYGVGRAAQPLFSAGLGEEASRLMPRYLRLPQAERELKKKLDAGGLAK